MALPKSLNYLKEATYEKRCRKLTEKVIQTYMPKRTSQTSDFTAEEEIELWIKNKPAEILMEYDHLFPLKLACSINLDPLIACSPPNLALVKRSDNRSKSTEIGKPIETLIREYDAWVLLHPEYLKFSY